MAPVWSVTAVMAMGSQYLPSLANVAKALAMVSGAVWVEPSRLPSVDMLIFGLGSPSAEGNPLRSPTASTIFWIPQKSSCAADAKVTVLMEL
ncbi:hypothetical protein D9M70_634420 [compost metagenome]